MCAYMFSCIFYNMQLAYDMHAGRMCHVWYVKLVTGWFCNYSINMYLHAVIKFFAKVLK